jgi:hypothetical protein
MGHGSHDGMDDPFQSTSKAINPVLELLCSDFREYSVPQVDAGRGRYSIVV